MMIKYSCKKKGQYIYILSLFIPHLPHHVTQRGNRRQKTFFCDDDYIAYLDCLTEGCIKSRTSIWAYCLMPNHIHLLLCPAHCDGLRAAVAEAHRKYTRYINFREKWRGHLWQDRFASFPTDESYTLAAARYIELNPVRAKIVSNPEDYPWSSAKAHISGHSDGITDTEKLLAIVPDWAQFLADTSDRTGKLAEIRSHESTGRPLGSPAFIERIEKETGRIVSPKKRGPKPKSN